MIHASSSVSTEAAIIVGLYSHDTDPQRRLDELEGLVLAAGGAVQQRCLQRRPGSERALDPATYLGRGKIEEIAAVVAEHQIGVVVFDNELSPAQIRTLERHLGCRVIDRSELILDIFAARARTRASRLQVELAQLQYTAPRLRGMWSHLARQAGQGGHVGLGTRGPGEQQIEIDRRIVQRRIVALRGEIERIVARRERQVAARAARAWCVGLVGYTNAGKSTLLNALTGADASAADQLFETLDTVSRRWQIQPGVAVPLSDTVGFVRDLPHHLVASFRSTLTEAVHADLLLHVVDASHPDAAGQVVAVQAVLDELGVEPGRVLGVLNKIDAVDNPWTLVQLRRLLPESVQISARTGQGLVGLAERVAEARSASWAQIALDVPHASGQLASLVHEHGEIRSEQWDEAGWHAEVTVPRAILPQLQAWIR